MSAIYLCLIVLLYLYITNWCSPQIVLDLGTSFTERFNAAMDQDFNTALALAHLFELARAINRFGNLKKAQKRGGPVVAAALEAFSLVGKALGMDFAQPLAESADFAHFTREAHFPEKKGLSTQGTIAVGAEDRGDDG